MPGLKQSDLRLTFYESVGAVTAALEKSGNKISTDYGPSYMGEAYAGRLESADENRGYRFRLYLDRVMNTGYVELSFANHLGIVGTSAPVPVYRGTAEPVSIPYDFLVPTVNGLLTEAPKNERGVQILPDYTFHPEGGDLIRPYALSSNASQNMNGLLVQKGSVYLDGVLLTSSVLLSAASWTDGSAGSGSVTTTDNGTMQSSAPVSVTFPGDTMIGDMKNGWHELVVLLKAGHMKGRFY